MPAGFRDDENAPRSTSAAPSPATPGPQHGSAGRDEWLTGVILGPFGLRAGWSILLFGILLYILATVSGTLLYSVTYDLLHLKIEPTSALSSMLGELEWVLALIVSLAVVAFLERRRIGSYHLAGPRRFVQFASGLAGGFLSLSLLVAVLSLGGWLRFGSAALSGTQILIQCLLWAVAFTFVGFTEEGIFRCFLQYRLSQGLSLAWSLGILAAICAWLCLMHPGNGAWGVYAFVGLGIGPILWLEFNKAPGRGFWQAAWVGSTAFGFIHTFNSGENWIGIFAAAAIGFVFCVSVRLTGSAWWAIGCHAAWDWAETYFYGTADSGFAAQGHLFTSTAAGSPLWSGGTDGPEGSLLVLPVIVIMLLAILFLYGRRRPSQLPSRAAVQIAS